jgi:PKD repeat protein
MPRYRVLQVLTWQQILQINNYSIAPITATYTITPTSSFGCSGDPIPVVITIKPEPIPKPISGRDKICVTDKNIVYNVNPEAGSTFTWTVPATVGTKTFDFNTNAILIDAAAVAGSGNITVYETNSFGCAGDPSSLAVQVFTQAAPENVVGPALVCANSTQVYSVTNRAGSLYTWTIPGGAAIIGDPSASSITIVYANVGGTILVRETNAAGCITNHNPFAVNVSALPTATISGTTTICDGASANLTVDFTGTGPYTFTYALNGVPQAPVVTAADPYTLNVTASGTYTVVNVTDATTCTNVGAGSAVVSYFPKPTGIISGTTAICQGNSATLTVTLTGTAPYTFTYTDGITPVTVTNHPTAVYTASVSPVADKSYTLVSLTDGNSCTGVISGSADITVNIPPVLTLTPTNLTCYNDNTGSVNLGVVGNAPFGYSWTGPDLFTANTEDISGLKAGIYTVVVTDTKGCTRTGNVTVNQPPQLTASAAITSSYNGANISCFGASDAVITVTAAGGTGAKTYQIIEQPANVTGAASGVFTGVGPGTVTVKVTDASGCTVNTAPLTVTQPAAVTAVAAITSNYSGSHISCFGANDARITVTASGGTGALSYVLNEEPANVTGATTGLFTGVGPGSKTVTVKDINNCTVITVPVVVVEPAIVNGTSSVTSNYNGSEVSCFGATDGIITATSSGGTGTRSYQIIEQPGNLTGATTGVFTGLSAGTYTVRIRDANNCTFVTPSVIIDNPVAVSASLAITSNYNGARVSCFGASDGIITATAAGGTGALVYVLDQNPANVTGAASGVFTGLPAGVYSVTVTDLNSCSKTTNSVTIVNPTAVSATAAVTSNYNGSQISCNGASDGRITVTATGGTGALSYLLVELPGNVTGAASGVFTGLPANTYTVRVRDLNNCEVITVPVTVSQPLAITATSAITSNYNGSHISCNGASDGRITVTAGGGTGLLTYVLNEIPANVSGLNTGIFTGLPAGPYTVTVTDKNSCSVVTVPVTIVAPAAVSVVASVTSNYNGSEVSCNGASDGIITAVGAGGTGALSYSLVQMPGNLTGTASGVFTGVPAGTYTVRITDVNNCTTLSANVVVDNPPALTATGSVTSNYNGSHVTCNGAADGVITITSGGGTGARVHVLDQNPANVTGAATGIFTGLTAGTYTVTVTDANGCTKTTPNITVNNPPAVTATAAVTSNYNGSQISCNGASDGRITVTASGGTGALSYLLVELPGNVTGAASGVFTGLPANTYTVRVRDVNNCEVITLPVTISNPPVLTATASVTSNYFGSQLSCNGASDGRITVVTAGGTGAPSYVLNELPANVTGAISGVFTGLPANTYTVTVTDKNGCTTVTAPVTITPPPALGITVNITSNYNGRDISCFGASDGRAEAVVTGGTGGYTYIWYSDPAMTIPIGQLTSLAINLAAGDYFVKVTDANGCMISGSVILAQPTALDAAITAQTNVACFGALTGAVTVTATAGTGTAPYEYSINGGSTWQPAGTFSSLAANNYTVLVKDVNGCIKVVPVAITQPAQLVVAVSSVTNVSCNGGNDGSVTVTVTAGTGVAPYQYSINGGPFQASATFGGLIAGTYNITARDANLCTQTVPVVITEPIVLQMTKTPDVLLNCFGDMTGLGTFFATGGTLPYTFAVVSNTTGGTVPAPGFNSQAFFTAGAGSITVRVTDAKGCSVQATINITQPALLTPGSIGSNQVICATSNPAMLTELTPSTGGPAAPVYQWQYSMAPGGPFMNIAGANGVTYTPPAAATTTFYYRRMVTSGLCLPVYSNEVEVLVNARPVGILTGGATICPGESTILKVNLPIGTGPFEIDLENYPGLTITGYTSDADITVTPAATTTYKVLRIRDANGCEVVNPSANIIGTALVTVRALPAITVQPVSKVVCEFGMTTYAITATGSDLTYQWFVDEGSGFIPVIDGGIYFGSGTPSLMIFGTNRLMNGFVYQARVTGCSTTVSSANATLTVNTAPEIINQPQDSTICSTQNASFAVNVQGTALVYQWQVNKGAGFVSVTDDVNFSGSNSATLNITNAPGSFNNYIFRVRISGTCGVPLFSNIVILRVNVPPTVALNPVNKAICANGGPVYFIANGSGMIDSLRWQVFSGGVWSDIYDDAVYSGTTSQQLTMVNVPLAYNGYQYRLGLKAFCATTYTNPATLTVNANPVVNFAAPLNACGGVPLVLNGNPSGGSGSYNQHIWTGDVGPLNNYFVQSPTFTSQIAGTYNLNYKVRDTNGCYADDDLQVIVDAPDASFAQDMLLGCTPLTVNFTKDMTGISKFWWTFGDGSPKDSVNANPTHIFTNVTAGSIEYREVELKVRSAGGCFDTYKSTVTVYPEVDASFTPNTLVVCSGQSITFTALSGASKYFWEFGDGANGFASNVTSHLYTNLTTAPVVQTVRLTTTSFYNCTDVQTVNITVMPVPLPQFTAAPPTQNFVNPPAQNNVVFTNMTNAGTWNWLWKFGDGGTSNAQAPTHTYTGVGNYTVTLVVSNANCSDSVKHPVTILPIAPVASFDTIPYGCAPHAVNINNTSLNTAVPGTTYFWDFGDGNTSTLKNPNYVYVTSGDFVIKLVVQGPGGMSVAQRRVSVYPTPKAYFEVTPTNVFINDERVRMFNLSSGADYFIWQFGDGDTSKVRDPFHKYTEEGVFDITLTAYSVNGCFDSFTLSPGVTVEPAGDLRFSTVFSPNKEGPIEVDKLPTGGEAIDQFFFPPIREKVLNYKLQIFNRWGTLIFESRDINRPWNGYYKGKLCKQGVYVWYVEGKYGNGAPFKKTGDTTLLH